VLLRRNTASGSPPRRLAKFEFSKGRREILAELSGWRRCSPRAVIPHGDHRIPEDVSYDNYRYYIREKTGDDRLEPGRYPGHRAFADGTQTSHP